jgi:hypothetical protein
MRTWSKIKNVSAWLPGARLKIVSGEAVALERLVGELSEVRHFESHVQYGLTMSKGRRRCPVWITLILYSAYAAHEKWAQ